jgi:hypothetical protein
MRISSPNSVSAGPEPLIPLPAAAVAPDPPGFAYADSSGIPGAHVEVGGGRSPKAAFETACRRSAGELYSERPKTSNGAEVQHARSAALVDVGVGGAAASVGDRAASI